MTYLFYDIETTGLNKAFDQILRFAAIRTDERFREIDRHLIKVRLRSDVVPAPEALLTHRISVEESQKEGVSELQAVREIHELLNEPDTISLGYNSLGFDDEFVRFSFYRNLLPPYTHQYNNNCGRMDIYPMTIIYRLMGSDLLEWPRHDGRPSLRLEHLSAANDLTSGRAHTAMADTEATAELARRLAENRALWNELTERFDKTLDTAHYERLNNTRIGDRSFPVGILISGRFGDQLNYQRPVIGLGRHRTYSNQVRLLALDTTELSDASGEELVDAATLIRKKLGVPDFLFPLDDSSAVDLSPERRQRANDNISKLRAHPERFYELVDRALDQTYTEQSEVDVDAALYQSDFWDDRSTDLCGQFHEAEGLMEKLDCIDRFRRSDLSELGKRILVRHFGDEVGETRLKEFHREYLQRTFPSNGEDVPVDHLAHSRRQPEKVLADIRRLRHERSLDAEQEDLLEGLEQYAAGVRASADTQTPHTSRPG